MFKNNQLIFFTFFDFFYMFDFFYTFLDFFYNFFCENDFTRKNCKKNQRLKKNSSYCFFLHTDLAKMNKKSVKKFIFEKKIRKKKLICLFLGQKHLFLGIFSVFSGFSSFSIHHYKSVHNLATGNN